MAMAIIDGYKVGGVDEPTVADEYNEEREWEVGEFCIYNSTLYKCNTATTGEFDSDSWDVTSCGLEMKGINSNLTENYYTKTEIETKLISRVLLWTNTTQMTSFAPQTVSLDLANYDDIEIETVFSGEDATPLTAIQKFKIGEKGGMSVLNYDEGLNMCTRTATSNINGVTFGGGNMIWHGNLYPNWNGRAVPRRIYGIKYHN